MQPSWKNRSIQNFISLFQQKCLSTCRIWYWLVFPQTRYPLPHVQFAFYRCFLFYFSFSTAWIFHSFSIQLRPWFAVEITINLSDICEVTSAKNWCKKGKNQSLWFSPLNVFFLLILLVFYSLCIVTDTDKNKNNNLISLDFINLQIFLYLYNFNDHKLNLTFMLPAH